MEKKMRGWLLFIAIVMLLLAACSKEEKAEDDCTRADEEEEVIVEEEPDRGAVLCIRHRSLVFYQKRKVHVAQFLRRLTIIRLQGHNQALVMQISSMNLQQKAISQGFWHYSKVNCLKKSGLSAVRGIILSISQKDLMHFTWRTAIAQMPNNCCKIVLWIM